VAHSGSLINLAKQPASTIQILGAEKALFRALKTKHDTPKYGLIFHASLIGQAAPKNKGKISRLLAAKTALAVRVDALGETTGPTIAIENRIKVENRIRQLEGGQKIATGTKASSAPAKYDAVSARALAPPQYSTASDMVVVSEKKLKRERDNEEQEEVVSDKKAKKVKKSKSSEVDADIEVEGEMAAEDAGEKKKKKKRKSESHDE
jgi:nucleolar protein 58